MIISRLVVRFRLISVSMFSMVLLMVIIGSSRMSF